MSKDIEIRIGPGSEMRLVEKDKTYSGKNRLAGYAALYDTDATIGGLFVERIAPGAFTKTLQEGDQRALWSHDMAQILGRVSAGTLRLWADKKGLSFELDLPDTQAGRDALTLVNRGDVSGMSIGFSVGRGKETWQLPEKADALPVRIIRELRLIEISVVGWPAYTETTVLAKE
jgi:uncharacterized protein